MLRSALIGRSILSSRSPRLHEQEAGAQGVALSYELIDFDDRRLGDDALPGIVGSLRDAGYAGFNVTYPFKQAIMPLLDDLDASAATVGAVNTVAIREGRLTGYNTDMSGFRQSMIDALPDVPLGHVLQLGAGGAGAAVAAALLSLGVGRLDVVDVIPEQSTALVERLRTQFGPDRVGLARAGQLSTDDVHGVVNTTPVGLASKPGMPIDPGLIKPHHWVADIIYFPLQTELLLLATRIGCKVMGGSGMVINQAAEAFAIITGLPADGERMASFF